MTRDEWFNLAQQQLAIEKAVHEFFQIPGYERREFLYAPPVLSWIPPQKHTKLGDQWETLGPSLWDRYETFRKALNDDIEARIKALFSSSWTADEKAVKAIRAESLPILQDPRTTDCNARKAQRWVEYLKMRWQFRRHNLRPLEGFEWHEIFDAERGEAWFTVNRPGIRQFRPWRRGDENIKSLDEIGEMTLVTLRAEWEMEQVKTIPNHFVVDQKPLGREPENIEEFLVYPKEATKSVTYPKEYQD